MAALYYIYRNLHKNTFSVRYKGKVIEHADCIIAHDVQFRVSETVRQRVLAEKKKYVHAYVVCDRYTVMDNSWQQVCNGDNQVEVSYNPYKQSTFTRLGLPIHDTSVVMLGNNKVWTGVC